MCLQSVSTVGMVVGTGLSRNVVKAEARRLIEEHGGEAYAKATTAVRLAMRRRNLKMSAFLAAVAGEVARQMERGRELPPLPRTGPVYLRLTGTNKFTKDTAISPAEVSPDLPDTV